MTTWPRPRSRATGPAARPGMPLLEIRGLRKRFGGLPALDGIDLEVARGELVAVIGPNGAGKSTLLKVVNGLVTPSAVDTLRLAGQDLAGLAPHGRRRAGIATVQQTPRGFGGLTVTENVALPVLFAGRPGSARVNQRDAQARARELLDLVGLDAKGGWSVSQLTLHEQRLLDLARALAGGPALLLLDEVMAGLDESEMSRLIGIVRRVRDRAGVTVLWVEHVMHAVRRLAERVVVLDAGRLLADGAPQDVMGQRRVIEAYLGRDGGDHAAG